MIEFLASGSVVDFEAPSIQAFLDASGWRDLGGLEAAERAYRFVRDDVGHSYDVCDPRVTLSASDALREGVGLCYSKSHLLAALLRGLGVPAAIRYQRLRRGEGFCLHAFNSIWLDGEWRDVDARGNNGSVSAEFLGALAFVPDPARGETTDPGYYIEPALSVVGRLRAANDALTMVLPSEV
jgi:transglutaminase-like putative cysteine protease